MVERGVDLYTVSKLLGHSRITMTERYAHLSQNHLRKMVGVLDTELTPQLTPVISEPIRKSVSY